MRVINNEFAIARWSEASDADPVQSELAPRVWLFHPRRLVIICCAFAIVTAGLLLLPKGARPLGLLFFLFVPTLGDLWAGNKGEGEKMATDADLALFDDPSDPHQELVEVTILRDGKELGTDRGIAEVCDGWLSFSGHQTAFHVSRADLNRARMQAGQAVSVEAVSGKLAARIQSPGGETTLLFKKLIRSPWGKMRSFEEDAATGENTFAGAFLTLPSTAPSKHLSTVRPPLVMQPRRPAPAGKPKVNRWPAVGAGLGVASVAYLITRDLEVACLTGGGWAELMYIFMRAGLLPVTRKRAPMGGVARANKGRSSPDEKA